MLWWVIGLVTCFADSPAMFVLSEVLNFYKMASQPEGALELKTVLNELSEVVHKTHEIGIQLSIPYFKMVVFEKEVDPLSSAIEFWLRGNVPRVPVTWTSIVQALKSSHVQENGVAERIAKKYCRQSSVVQDDDHKPAAVSESSSPAQNNEVDLKQQSILDLEKIKEQYANYVDRIQTIVIEKGVNANRLRSYLLNLRHTDKEQEVLQLSKDFRTEDVFSALSSCTSFLDYGIYAKILKRFGQNESHEDLNYPACLRDYLDMHTINQFVRLFPNLNDPYKLMKLNDNSKELKIKFSFEGTQTLKTLKAVAGAVANVLGIEESTLRLYNVKDGCVLATFLLDVLIADAIFTVHTAFTEEQMCAFRVLSLLWLECNGFKFDFSQQTEAQTLKSDVVKAWRYACHNGLFNFVRVMAFELKMDASIQDCTGLTPLHYACEEGLLDIVMILVSKFESAVSVPNTTDKHGRNSLHYASKKGNFNVVRALTLIFPGSLNMQDNAGYTPLHCACENGHLNTVRVLVEAKADFLIEDHAGCTPLQYACGNKHLEIVKVLVFEFMDTQEDAGRTLFFYACEKGLLDVVRILASEFLSEISILDDVGCTPLHYACEKGIFDIVTILVTEFKTDMSILDHAGRTPLHYACENGHLDVVRVVLSELNVNLRMQDDGGCTAPMLAARGGHEDVVLALLHDYSRPRDKEGWGVFHHTCAGGDINLVQTFIHDNKENFEACSKKGSTPLRVTVDCGKFDAAAALHWDPNVSDHQGQTLLHYACKAANIKLVYALIHEYKANINAYSKLVSTPLHVAFRAEQYEVLLSLMSDPSCDPYMKDQDGQTILHLACKTGNIDLVYTLLHTHKMDVNALNEEKDTLLHVAVSSNQYKTALALIKEHGCDITRSNKNGWTVLHMACKQGAIDLVHALIRDMPDINVRNDKNDTPLHMAAWGGHYDVVLALVSDARCDSSVLGCLERTALHVAAFWGHHKVVEELLKYTPLLVDEFGNTPLHLASQNSHVSTVQCFLHNYAPVLVKNNKGFTPRDLALGECGRILEEYIREYRKRLKDQSTFLKLAKKKYSNSLHWITKIFVLGNPGAGKSSFIESLKRESFFESFRKVSESSVPPHTAGIIPSVHTSKQYGRVLFYDFAGDAEYYSSHAAIFESLASSRKLGDSIFIIVVDLREDGPTINTTLHYWFSFIQYQSFSRPYFIVVGSHLDQCVEQSGCFDEFCIANDVKNFMLDCRDPRSNEIAEVRKQIFIWVNESQKYRLSREARMLLGLLEKDFSAITACPVQILVSHIKDSGVWLPVEPTIFYQILLELHEVGVLLLLGDCTKDTDHVILNISKLTNEVHKALFATSAFSNIQDTHPNSNFNIGILPDSILKDVLPQYITKECLIHLQYCQEIRHTDIGIFPSLELTDSTSQSFLFFPALCRADKGEVPWDESTGHSFSIGWLALCTDLHDYFPPRFLHVLLLRLVHRFTLSVPAQLQTAHASPEHSRRCTMWKKGVYWKMPEGVDCMVELVKGSKGVVVLTKCSVDYRIEDCVVIFSKIVSCVMEAKADFCNSTKPAFFLLDSSAEADYLNEDHQFAMSEVERDLKSPEGKHVIISVSGRGVMELSNFQWMLTLTHWNAFFPITDHYVLHTLEEVDVIFELGLRLGASKAFLESLRADFPSDVNQRRKRLVSWWMKSSLTPPCWYTLVEALKDIEMQVLADKVQDDHGLHIQLQEKLLCEETQSLKPDEEFLHSLSGVVGSRWPSLALSLALSEEEIEELKEKMSLSQEKLALWMLKIWASKEEATYGQLYHQLKTISLFQYSS